MCREDERRLRKEIEGLRRSKAQMDAAQREAARTTAQSEMLWMPSVTCLKRAGPEMTKELLRRVSGARH